MFKLTNDNYFSKEADMQYLSVSQYKAFTTCEFAAYHKYVTGKNQPETSDALLIGAYVDAYFSGEFKKWVEKHPEIFTNKGDLRAQFKHADVMINHIQRDELFMSTLQGEKQKIIIVDIDGIMWKCKPDFIDLENLRCFDLKTTKSFALEWDEYRKCKLPFYENYNYFLQFAVYKEALYQQYDKAIFDMFISAITKEPSPDIKILSFNNMQCRDRMTQEFEIAKINQDTILKIKEGDISEDQLIRCEQCDYCKQTKKLKIFEDAEVHE